MQSMVNGLRASLLIESGGQKIMHPSLLSSTIDVIADMLQMVCISGSTPVWRISGLMVVLCCRKCYPYMIEH